MQPFAITIGRSLGSGGRYVGKHLAETFGASYFDKEILSLAAKESGLCQAVFERKDEHKGFFRGVLGPFHNVLTTSDYGHNALSDENLFRWQSNAIRTASEKGSCVFIGRAADYVLRDHPRLVSVFITADMADRVARVMERMQVNEREAVKLIEHGDRERANFYNFYNERHWGEATTYDLCINSSRLGLEQTAQFVAEFVKQRLQLT